MGARKTGACFYKIQHLRIRKQIPPLYNIITVRKKETKQINRDETLQATVDFIDENIKNELNVKVIAENAGYSEYHFNRVFTKAAGVSVMNYVTWRRLQFAAYDLSLGKKVIDAAMEYDFETHAGFTKAFKRVFGFPPVLCYTRLNMQAPAKMNAAALKQKFKKFNGGNAMTPHIYEFTPFAVAGYPSRHVKANIKNTSDAPTFWNTINMDCGPYLKKLFDAFPKSKHCEISMCYDVDEKTSEFTYMLGRGIDNPEDLANITPDMTRVAITGGLYAVFSTPPVEDSYIQTAQDVWNEIFMKWLPQSEFEFDDTRHEFEYHDERDHGRYFGGKLQMDICVPIRQREEEKRKSQLSIKK